MIKVLIASAAGAAAVAALASATPACAEGIEVGLNYNFVDAGNVDLGAVGGRVGYRSHWWGVEGEASWGVDDDTFAGAKVEMRHQFAGYGVFNVPMNENFDLFARVGYGQGKIAAKTGVYGDTGTSDSWNYGVGGQYFFGGHSGIRGDYTRWDFSGHDDADVWSLAYVYRF